MVWLLLLLMLSLLLRAQVTMEAASAACRLFVTAVLPGLFPYMVLSQLLISRVRRLSPALVMALGWGGGSPTGARLVRLGRFSRHEQVRLLVSCATMSPMFLLGTLGGWLGSPLAGAVCLGSVIIGGWVTGRIADSCVHTSNSEFRIPNSEFSPLSFGEAVEASARTMLLVCGTMVMLRVFAALAGEVLPDWAALPVTTLLEVTTGAASIAALPLPLMWRTALLSGATGFGGAAVIMQNRAVAGDDGLPLGSQIGWQALHGGISFLIALGLMWFIC